MNSNIIRKIALKNYEKAHKCYWNLIKEAFIECYESFYKNIGFINITHLKNMADRKLSIKFRKYLKFSTCAACSFAYKYYKIKIN